MDGTNKKEYEKKWCYFPMFASITEGDGKYKTTLEEDSILWAKYDSLSTDIRDILTARELPEAIYTFGQNQHLGDGEIAFISQAVRKFYFHEWSIQECGNNIYQFFSQKGREAGVVQGMIGDFQRKILSVRPKADVDPTDANLEHLAIVQALGKYPRLGEQQITKERIRVRNQPESVRPSLMNWMRVYRDELGVGYHEPMIRGKFLFDSENGKRLSSEERERVNLILRSIEENFALDIDAQKYEIVFPTFAPTAAKPVPVSPNAVSARPVSVTAPFQTAPLPATGFYERSVTSPAPTPNVSNPASVKAVAARPFVAPVSVKPVSVATPISSAPAPTPTPTPAPAPAPVSAPAWPQSPAPVTPAVPPQAPLRQPVSFKPVPPSNLPVESLRVEGSAVKGIDNTASISFSSRTVEKAQKAESPDVAPSVYGKNETFSSAGHDEIADTPIQSAGGSITISSSHSLPFETHGQGDFSIHKDEVVSLPSGLSAFGVSRKQPEAHTPASVAPATPAVSVPPVAKTVPTVIADVSGTPAPLVPSIPSFQPVLVQETVKPATTTPAVRVNPFSIHPVSFQTKSTSLEEDVDNILNR